jgi:hypothetical protein
MVRFVVPGILIAFWTPTWTTGVEGQQRIPPTSIARQATQAAHSYRSFRQSLQYGRAIRELLPSGGASTERRFLSRPLDPDVPELGASWRSFGRRHSVAEALGSIDRAGEAFLEAFDRLARPEVAEEVSRALEQGDEEAVGTLVGGDGGRFVVRRQRADEDWHAFFTAVEEDWTSRRADGCSATCVPLLRLETPEGVRWLGCHVECR